MSAKDHVFTLGTEEEFQIIDPETRELRSHIQQILADGRMVLQERVKPELHQSIAELGTEICSILLIPGTSSVEHLRENVAGAGLQLSEHVIRELNGIAG